jgi:hypothetical protein
MESRRDDLKARSVGDFIQKIKPANRGGKARQPAF